MKIKRTTILGFAAMFLFLAGVTFAQDVSTDYDKSFDFKTLKTFAVKIGTSWGNPLSENRVVSAVESEIIKKGWTKTNEDAADAIVMLHGATEQKKDINTFYTGYSGWGYRGWYGGGMGSAHTTVSEYKVGTLVTDIFDAKTKKLVFRAVAQDEISDKPEKNEKKIKKATEKVFKKFPPGSEKKK
jgi:Domain of unknown function (DUF4136)